LLKSDIGKKIEEQPVSRWSEMGCFLRNRKFLRISCYAKGTIVPTTGNLKEVSLYIKKYIAMRYQDEYMQ